MYFVVFVRNFVQSSFSVAGKTWALLKHFSNHLADKIHQAIVGQHSQASDNYSPKLVLLRWCLQRNEHPLSDSTWRALAAGEEVRTPRVNKLNKYLPNEAKCKYSSTHAMPSRASHDAWKKSYKLHRGPIWFKLLLETRKKHVYLLKFALLQSLAPHMYCAKNSSSGMSCCGSSSFFFFSWKWQWHWAGATYYVFPKMYLRFRVCPCPRLYQMQHPFWCIKPATRFVAWVQPESQLCTLSWKRETAAVGPLLQAFSSQLLVRFFFSW